MAQYVYLTADLLGGDTLAELPLTGVSYERLLNGAGAFQGRLAMGDARVTALDPKGSTQPARTALYVVRDGAIVWGGIIWYRAPSNNGFAMDIKGAEFISYFVKRNIATTLTFAAVDQLTIARTLITYAQGTSAAGNIGVVVNSETSGVVRDRTYYGYELKSIGAEIMQLSAVQGGFDVNIDCMYVAGAITKTLVLSYPRRGATAQTSGLVFELPATGTGNIIGYTWPEDGAGSATTAYAIGSGTGPTMVISSATNSGLTGNGYPQLDFVASYKSDLVQATVDAHAQADLQARAPVGVGGIPGPLSYPTLMLRADRDPVYGSYTIGDECRVRITDSYFAAGVDAYFRIIAIKVAPQSGSTAESVTVTLGPTVA